MSKRSSEEYLSLPNEWFHSAASASSMHCEMRLQAFRENHAHAQAYLIIGSIIQSLDLAEECEEENRKTIREIPIESYIRKNMNPNFSIPLIKKTKNKNIKNP